MIFVQIFGAICFRLNGETGTLEWNLLFLWYPARCYFKPVVLPAKTFKKFSLDEREREREKKKEVTTVTMNNGNLLSFFIPTFAPESNFLGIFRVNISRCASIMKTSRKLFLSFPFSLFSFFLRNKLHSFDAHFSAHICQAATFITTERVLSKSNFFARPFSGHRVTHSGA